MTKSMEKMTDEELDAEIDQRSRRVIEVKEERQRLMQERDVRRALAALPEETRRVVKLRLEAGVGPKGSDVGGEKVPQ